MKLLWVGAMALVFVGCVSKGPKPLRTEIVTFPRGGIVELNGQRLGQEPVDITLPQNDKGQLTGRAEIRALPSHHHLHAQSKVVSPEETPDYKIQIPARIMLDLRQVPSSSNRVDLVRLQKEQRIEAKQERVRTSQSRGKPSRPVGDY